MLMLTDVTPDIRAVDSSDSQINLMCRCRGFAVLFRELYDEDDEDDDGSSLVQYMGFHARGQHSDSYKRSVV